jgi:hypothetical protein
MKKLLLLAAASLLLVVPAGANFTVKDSTGATVTFSSTAVSGVNAPNVGGFDLGSNPVTTVVGASHNANSSVGGLLTIPVARTNGGSGRITDMLWVSYGGHTLMLQIRLWDKNPTGATGFVCTDGSAYASGTATDATNPDINMIAAPLTFTPKGPEGTITGDAKTYGYLTGLSIPFKNKDGTTTRNVYACIVTVSADTADASKRVSLSLSATQN